MAFTIKMPTGQRIQVNADAALIGRDRNCQIVVADPGVEPIHAQIRKVAGRWMVEAQGDWKIQVGSGMPGRKSWLKTGDVIRLTESGPGITFDETMPLPNPPSPEKTPVSRPAPVGPVLALPLDDEPVSRTRSAEARRPESGEDGPSPSARPRSSAFDTDEQEDDDYAPRQRRRSSSKPEKKSGLAATWARLSGKQKAGVIGGGILVLALIGAAADNNPRSKNSGNSSTGSSESGGSGDAHDRRGGKTGTQAVRGVSRENYNRIKDGMTIKQVEDILGPGQELSSAGDAKVYTWQDTDFNLISIGFFKGRVKTKTIASDK